MIGGFTAQNVNTAMEQNWLRGQASITRLFVTSHLSAIRLNCPAGGTFHLPITRLSAASAGATRSGGYQEQNVMDSRAVSYERQLPQRQHRRERDQLISMRVSLANIHLSTLTLRGDTRTRQWVLRLEPSRIIIRQ